MSLRFLADNDLNPAIGTGLTRREPTLDFRSAQQASLDGMPDRRVLELAAREHRILVSCDKHTMLPELYRFVAEGNHSPGLLVVVPQHAEVAAVMNTILMIWAASDAAEWENRAVIIPF